MNTVVLVVLALAAGLTVGYAKRGRLRRLATPLPVRNRLLLTALGLYIIGVFASWAWESALPVLSALSWFVVAFYAWLNRWIPGARLIALGLAANAFVLLFNGAMPVSADAAARAGTDTSAISAEDNTERVDDSTRLGLLAKKIPVAFPPSPEVVSVGDIAVAAGLATVIATGMTGHRPATNALPAKPRRRDLYADALNDDPHSTDPSNVDDATEGDDTTEDLRPGDDVTPVKAAHSRHDATHGRMRHRPKATTAPIRR